jgi:D-alanyl-D-alanine carboxypeptidase
MGPTIFTSSEVSSGIDLLSAWIEAQMAYSGLPGLSIGVVHDQDLIWAQGFGYAKREGSVRATPSTLYRIASITKLFTATAVLQLRDARKLQLDDPVTKHLPWFNIQNRHPDAPPITVRHLLTHTSGLPREAPFPYWTDGSFPTTQEIRESMPGQETILPTETRWKYSNLALSFAGEVVAAVAGQAFADYVHEYILGPLGMSNTHVNSPDANDPLLATGYSRRLPDGSRDMAPFTDGKGITSAANMTTSVEDLARFAQLQFRDGPAMADQILCGSTLREMQRVHWLEPGWQAGWGLGFRIERKNDKTYIRHGGAVRGYRTEFALCPADKTGVIVLTNADDGNPLAFAEKAFQWVGPAILEATKPKPGATRFDPTWQPYVGKYRDAWGDLQVLVLNGELVALNPSELDPIPSLAKLRPEAEGTFRIETQDGYGNHGEAAVFEMDAQGKVALLKFGATILWPVSEW